MVGGAQTFVLRQATGLAKNHKVYLYNYRFPHPPADKVIDASFPAGIEILHFSLPAWLARLIHAADRRLARAGARFNAFEFLRKVHFLWILLSRRIDLVNSHLYHSDAFTASGCPVLRVPLVITDHGDYRYVVSQRQATAEAVRKIFRVAAAVVYISDSNLVSIQPYLSGYRGILRKIYYGFEAGNILSSGSVLPSGPVIPSGAVVFGMVARGVPEKGWEEAILAFQQAEKELNAPVFLILVGDSPHLQQLKAQYHSGSVYFTGYTDQPQQWVQIFDAGLLPTYFPGESLPNTVIEYLALGKPVIATDVGGIAEMITVPGTGQQAGQLVPIEEGRASVKALAETMAQYASQPHLLQEHRQKALLAFSKFDLNACITNYELLLGEITSKKIDEVT